jgi:hypothetical protein
VKGIPSPDAYAKDFSDEDLPQDICPFGSTRDIYKKEVAKSPGPAHYGDGWKEVKRKRKSGSRTERGDIWDVRRRAPDPGHYEFGVDEALAVKRKRKRATPEFKSPIDDRDILTSREGVPGPQYMVVVKGGCGVGRFRRGVRWKDDEYIGDLKIVGGPPPGAYEVDRPNTSREPTFSRMSGRRGQQEVGSGLDPAVYQRNQGSSFVKPSYNVRLDPELKVSPKFRT